MNWQPSATLDNVRQRARIYAQIREFFQHRDVLEVDTPLVSLSTNPDPQISSILVYDRDQPAYLQTSPEFAMKRLLAAGSGSIYQICHAFREAESGRLHHPEFSLLEWYRTGFDYLTLMDEIELLIDHLSGKTNKFKRVSYQQLLIEYAGVDFLCVELKELRVRCEGLLPGTNCIDLDVDQCLDLLVAMVVAPKLRGYIFVYDYPGSQASLARLKPSNPLLSERFELFYNDLELANGFSELTDAAQQRNRFENDNRQRQLKNLPQYPLDEQLLAALEAGLPECAGVALGLDRLMMVLLESHHIDEVLTFNS